MATRKKKGTVNTTVKDGYVGGMDGGAGGVGFGVPDDYVGSANQNLSTEEAPQISSDGQIKSDELLQNLPPMSAEPLEEAPPYTYNVTPVESEDGSVTLNIEAEGVNGVNVETDAPVVTQGHFEDTAIRTAFYEKYSQLDQSNPIRQRAEKVDITLANTIKQCDVLSQRVEEQKTLAAKTLETVKYIIGEIIRVKNEEPTFERLEKIYSQWISPLLKTYNDANFKLDDVCPFVYSAIIKLHEIPQDSTVIPSALDEIVGILDEAMTHLIEVKEKGYGNALLDYYNCLSQQDSIASEAERMAKDVEKALKADTRNSFMGKLENVTNKTAATKQTYRLMENLEQSKTQKDVSDVPNDVPNYRLAIDQSPRVCGNCRFFEGTEGVMGHCTAFDFMAKANYVCDAWQSPNLTSSHTTVRSIPFQEEIMSDRTKADYPLNKKTPVDYVNTNPVPRQGVVIQEPVDEIPLDDMTFFAIEDESYNQPEPPAPNAAVRTTFLPGDTVYSKSLRSMGVVQGSVVQDGIKMYSIKLINAQGMASGAGYTYGNDLVARSSQATKNAVNANNAQTASKKSISIKADGDDPTLDQMVEVTRSIYKALKAVCDAHADVVAVPLSNKDILNPLREDMLKSLEDPIFQGVSTGAKRKYYRAIQTALVSIGAARQVLFEGYKTINALKKSNSATAKSDMQATMINAQTDAYERVKYAFGQIKDALTLPSATHNMPAPGTGEEEAQ